MLTLKVAVPIPIINAKGTVSVPSSHALIYLILTYVKLKESSDLKYEKNIGTAI